MLYSYTLNFDNPQAPYWIEAKFEGDTRSCGLWEACFPYRMDQLSINDFANDQWDIPDIDGKAIFGNYNGIPIRCYPPPHPRRRCAACGKRRRRKTMWQIGKHTDWQAPAADYESSQILDYATEDEEKLGIAYRIDVRFPSRDIGLVTEWQHIDHPDRHWFQGIPESPRKNLDGEGDFGSIFCEYCGTVVGTLFTR